MTARRMLGANLQILTFTLRESQVLLEILEKLTTVPLIKTIKIG